MEEDNAEPPNSHAARVELLKTMFKSLETYPRSRSAGRPYPPGLSALRPYAPGWSVRRVAYRIIDIQRFATLNSEAGIPLRQRRQIERSVSKTACPKSERPRLKRGGDRRSGAHSLRGSVLRMLVRLYIEAHAEPAFSIDGPLVRFVNAGAKLILGRTKPFTSEAVRGERRRMRRFVPARLSPGPLYRPKG